MKRKLYRLLCVVLLMGGSSRLPAQILTVQFDQSATAWNLQSEGGVPISAVFNNPPGSDGLMPAANSSYGSYNPASASQFQGLISFGGACAPTDWTALSNWACLQGTNAFSSAVAEAMQLPVGLTNASDLTSVCMVLVRAQIGAPYLSRQVSFLFGSVIPAPGTDANGVPLATNITSSSYWQAEPPPGYNNTNQYYWSPNAGQVFATQPGPIAITWATTASWQSGNVPAYTNLFGAASFYTNGGNIYQLYTVNYVVSGNPVKPPQNIYWTEDTFQALGYPVTLPQGRVTAIHVAYNSAFPETVATPYQDPNSTQTNTETRTLWLNTQGTPFTIHADNAQGTVFVELLGQPVAGGQTSQYLGFEIVNVAQTAAPADVTINLGEGLTPFQDGWEGGRPAPSPVGNNLANPYYYSQSAAGGRVLYADAVTTSQNDLQVYWLYTGVGGLQWPNRLVSYTLAWPGDPSQYSHYLRPLAASQAQAALTAVQLDPNEAPNIDYQDPLDQIRGFLTPSAGYYTWLTNNEPAHRALLRFTANGQVRFERVFSWLDIGITNNALLAGSVAADLSVWNATNESLTFSNLSTAPYETELTATVGDRIEAPPGEMGNSGEHWAGWINQANGTAFNPGAYFDPFACGFSVANAGAIIPVNAIPGANQLEVWWFRQNGANPAVGFQPVYWPSVIGHYTIQWPSSAPQIVLAGGQGSGPLSGAMAEGRIYYQNDPAQSGYNPNEEHALMLGGAVYALRDDLNNTNAGPNYSSAPFVLLDYVADDGRPAMQAFQVRREAPEQGLYFDYVVTAGTQLQAPMPLPLMAPPVAVDTNSPSGLTNYDTAPPANSADLPAGWTANAAGGPYANYQGFTFQDRNNNFWVYRGLNAGLPPLQAGQYDPASGTFGALPPATALLNQFFTYYIPVSRLPSSLTIGTNSGTLPSGLTLTNTGNSLVISGTPTALGTNVVSLLITDMGDDSSVTNSLTLVVTTNAAAFSTLGPLVITGTNLYSGTVETFTNRPPALAVSPIPANSFTMRYYYKTMPGFAWPELGNASNWPAVGTIVPYLLPVTNGVFIGDPTNCNFPSQDIVYRPVWPSATPALEVGQTLTTPVNGLAGVRGQDSVRVLYQQSIATNFAAVPATPSVVLFDPTSQKKSSLAAMNGLPASIVTDTHDGLSYFPNLPPNLISRVWFDPNGASLVFQGQFVQDPAAGNYLMLNILRGDDLAAVDNLCSQTDPLYSSWTNAVAQLSAPEFTKSIGGNPAQPGAYAINAQLTVTNYAGDLVEVTNADTQVDSYAMSAAGPGLGYVTYVVANDHNPQHAGDPVQVYIARVAPPLFTGALVVDNPANASPFSQLITFQHTADLAGRTSQYAYDWRYSPPVNGQPPTTSEDSWQQLFQTNSGPVYTLGASGVLGLSDNYVSMRYGRILVSNNVLCTNWAAWANPILAEGWITRVTQNLDPIAGETQNLYENPANTTASLISLAGARWNGAVPLNAASLTNYGLIQLYETVLDEGKSMTINAGINYGPANQALLLAAGYLNDLYTTLGNDAWANSLNPTIGFGTDNQTYGAVATASFCFEGEVPTLLAQNLALLRGRDDSLSPGVNLPPVYNRLYWNYTYGIDAGEVIYAMNYNITDQNGDGVVNAADAAIMYPQGHGDAYGHYLTALMNYYGLLMNPNFDWVPQSQTVQVLGAAVTVNYQDESKFAASAAALARTGRQIFDLEWRQDYQPGTAGGWGYFATNHTSQNTYIGNGQTQPITRYWGMDHWASRVGQGAYLNWVVGNAILPPKDTNPNDQGVQIVDRTTVQDLQELPQTAAALENDMDNANAGFTPLGLAQNAIPFDINPQEVTGANPQTHFEQIYARAVQALNNAVAAFNAAENVTLELRQEQNSLSDLQAAVTAQELAYNDQLIELYGTPYPDDIGAGQTYPQGYTGPDLIHYMYVDNVNTNTYGGILPDSTTNQTFLVDIQQLPANWVTNMYQNFDFITPGTAENYDQNTNCVTFNIGPDGFSKPASWTSERGSLGSIQTAAAAVNAAQDKLRQACADAVIDKQALDRAYFLFQAQAASNQAALTLQTEINAINQDINNIQTGYNISDEWLNNAANCIGNQLSLVQNDLPDEIIVGLADGGDQLKLAGLPVVIALDVAQQALLEADAVGYTVAQTEMLNDQKSIQNLSDQLATNQLNLSLQNAVNSLGQQLSAVQNDLGAINQAQVALNGARANYQSLVAQGNRLQQERLTFRQHTAAQVQGYTTTDAAFLIFQNENLERYTTLFNLAAEYTYMAANAYDYETGLLNTPAGAAFLNQIVSSCAIGVIQNGEPQISGTDMGDPGLANALAEMNADWQVLKGRLGFNNPDGYGTIVSLRTENYRIKPDSTGDNNWQQVLQKGLVPDLRADSDVEENCLQIDDGSGQAVPGIILTFDTTITEGQNLFGQPLGPGDHSFSSSSFATKIFSVGVDFDGYVGMDNPVSASGASPSDPTLSPNGLAATPYVYLIPCGSDSMRSPPLGDTSTIRTWNVDDVAIPLPFNIGASDFSAAPFYTSADSLSEPLFAVRKHEAFRPVSTTEAFNTSIYGATGALQPSEYTNRRLIGRSVWNSKWKLVIPGNTLLADPNQGLARFINSVKDVHLYFITYSYAGN
jgi:hypothetical protein